MKLLSRFSYLRLLASSALVAAAPTIDEVAWMYDAARVSTQVASNSWYVIGSKRSSNDVVDGAMAREATSAS
ncbi:jg7498 [Pararge aegeria aegeria]|uniref:Jg7498 protein n=1 Tax=Pararge aegeria aegeria TaxID=348720 RepID=A0A8S4RCR7_9NEOP|nr:jg7498 [Pararge aegeria aegeria]